MVYFTFHLQGGKYYILVINLYINQSFEYIYIVLGSKINYGFNWTKQKIIVFLFDINYKLIYILHLNNILLSIEIL